MYKNDDQELNLSCKCTVLCYILEYIYVAQIAKRRISPVLAFNMQIPDQVECLGRVCMLKASAGPVCLFATCTIFIYIHEYSNM